MDVRFECGIRADQRGLSDVEHDDASHTRPPEGFPVGARLRCPRLRAMSAPCRAVEGGPGAWPSRADGRGLERPSCGAAVREAVAAHENHIRDRCPRARRPGGRAAARCGARPARAGCRRGAKSRTVDRRDRHPDVLAASARRICGGDTLPARRERTDRRRTPMPGHRRHADAPAAPGPVARTDDCLYRRRQQRRHLARARRGHARRARSLGQPRGLSDARRRRATGNERRPLWGPSAAVQRAGCGGDRRGCRVH